MSSQIDGYLSQETNVKYDDDLNLILNEWVKSITGISEELVRPLWQTDAPNIPEKDVNWISFGVSNFDSENLYFQQNANDSSSKNNEELTILMRFYGKDAQSIANNFKASIQIPQNNYQLNKLGLTYHRSSNVSNFPELYNNQWFKRFDLTVYLRRRNDRTYQIKTIESFDFKFIVER